LFWDSLELLISGLATGAIYALVATGFTLLWQTSSTVNFAQGDFVTLPAFAIIGLHAAGLPLPLAMLGGMAIALIVLGALFKLLLVDPMLRHGLLPLGIAAIALGVGLQEGVKAASGRRRFRSRASLAASILVAADRLGRTCWYWRPPFVHCRAASFSATHANRAMHAGDGAEPGGGAHPGDSRLTHDFAYVPDQRGRW